MRIDLRGWAQWSGQPDLLTIEHACRKVWRAPAPVSELMPVTIAIARTWHRRKALALDGEWSDVYTMRNRL
jgi:hypothetical protein